MFFMKSKQYFNADVNKYEYCCLHCEKETHKYSYENVEIKFSKSFANNNNNNNKLIRYCQLGYTISGFGRATYETRY